MARVRAELLTDKQAARLRTLFGAEEHVEVEATWGIYQRMVTAYREPDRGLGKFVMQQLIDSLTSGIPAGLVELRKLGRTLKQRAIDVLARRLPLALVDLAAARAALPRVIEVMAKELGWDGERCEKERATADERLGAAL